MTTEARITTPRSSMNIRTVQQQIPTMKEGDVIELMTINGHDITARRTAERTEIEAKIKITVACPAATDLAVALLALGAAGIAVLLMAGGDVFVIGGVAIFGEELATVMNLLEAGIAFGALVSFLARYVCN